LFLNYSQIHRGDFPRDFWSLSDFHIHSNNVSLEHLKRASARPAFSLLYNANIEPTFIFLGNTWLTDYFLKNFAIL